MLYCGEPVSLYDVPLLSKFIETEGSLKQNCPAEKGLPLMRGLRNLIWNKGSGLEWRHPAGGTGPYDGADPAGPIRRGPSDWAHTMGPIRRGGFDGAHLTGSIRRGPSDGTFRRFNDKSHGSALLALATNSWKRYFFQSVHSAKLAFFTLRIISFPSPSQAE